MDETLPPETERVLRGFFKDGRLVTIPAKERKRLVVLRYLRDKVFTEDRAYPEAERLWVVQDNWPVHRHDEVAAALKRWPRIEPVWLPTYAPWLNPIEKLWRRLRQSVLKLHRLAGDWAKLRQRVNEFLGQFGAGSEDLLRYVGLLGEGKLAQALRRPP